MGLGNGAMKRLGVLIIVMAAALWPAAALAAPSSPALVGSEANSTSLSGATAVAVSGNYAFATASWPGQLTAVNINNLNSASTLYSTLASTYLENGSNITIANNDAFVVSNRTGRVPVLRVRRPAATMMGAATALPSSTSPTRRTQRSAGPYRAGSHRRRPSCSERTESQSAAPVSTHTWLRKGFWERGRPPRSHRRRTQARARSRLSICSRCRSCRAATSTTVR
jgi:hypothetical protein